MTGTRPLTATLTKRNLAMTTTESAPRVASLPVRGILLSAVLGGAVASIANAIVAFAGLSAGADPALPGLTPPAFITLSVIGVLGGAIGWTVVSRTRTAKRNLTVLVPGVLGLSLIPNVLLAVTAGTAAVVTAAVTLGIMHVVTVVVAVPVYREFLPLPRSSM